MTERSPDADCLTPAVVERRNGTRDSGQLRSPVNDSESQWACGFDISAGLERAPRAQILATVCFQRHLEDRVTAR